jgi:hypothetical protein
MILTITNEPITENRETAARRTIITYCQIVSCNYVYLVSDNKMNLDWILSLIDED